MRSVFGYGRTWIRLHVARRGVTIPTLTDASSSVLTPPRGGDLLWRGFHASSVLERIRRKTRVDILRPRRKRPPQTVWAEKLREAKSKPFTRPPGWLDRPVNLPGSLGIDPDWDADRTYAKLMGETRTQDERERAKEEEDLELDLEAKVQRMVVPLEQVLPEVAKQNREESGAAAAEDGEETAREAASPDLNASGPSTASGFANTGPGAEDEGPDVNRFQNFGIFEDDDDDGGNEGTERVTAYRQGLEDESLATPDVRNVVALSKWRRTIEVANIGRAIEVFFTRRNRTPDSYVELVRNMESCHRESDILAVLKHMNQNALEIDVRTFCRATRAVARAGLLEHVVEICKLTSWKLGHILFEDNAGKGVSVRRWMSYCQAAAFAETGHADLIKELMRQENEFVRGREGVLPTPSGEPQSPFSGHVHVEDEAGEEENAKKPDEGPAFLSFDRPDLTPIGGDPLERRVENWVQRDRRLFGRSDVEKQAMQWTELGRNPYLWSSLLRAYCKKGDRGNMVIAYHWFRNKCTNVAHPRSVYHHIFQQKIGMMTDTCFEYQAYLDMKEKEVVPNTTTINLLLGNADADLANVVGRWAQEHNLPHTLDASIRHLKARRGVPEIEPEEIVKMADDDFSGLESDFGGSQFISARAYSERMSAYADALRQRRAKELEEDEMYGTRVMPEEGSICKELESARGLKREAEDRGEKPAALCRARFLEILLWSDQHEEALAYFHEHFVPREDERLGPVTDALATIWGRYLDALPNKFTTDEIWDVFEGLVKNGRLKGKAVSMFSKYFCLKKDIGRAEQCAFSLRYVPKKHRALDPMVVLYFDQLCKLVDDPDAYTLKMRAMGVAVGKPRTWYKRPRRGEPLPSTLRSVNWWKGMKPQKLVRGQGVT